MSNANADTGEDPKQEDPKQEDPNAVQAPPVPTRPRFRGRPLVAALTLVTVLFVAVAAVGWVSAENLGLFRADARGEGERILANTAVVWLGMTGLLCLLVGSIILVTEIQEPIPPAERTPELVDAAVIPAIGGVYTALSTALKDLKGPRPFCSAASRCSSPPGSWPTAQFPTRR